MPLKLSNGLYWKALLLYFLSLATLVHAKHPDFDYCYTEYVQNKSSSNFSDPDQCWFTNSTTGLPEPQDRVYLNLDGCYRLCGHGYDLWPAADTGKRFALFILPLVVLAGKYAWVPVSASTVFSAFVHLIGDPVDSFWSTLTRQEKTRRSYHLALELAPTVARELAAVWMAYDLWWQDATKHFEEMLDRRSHITRRLYAQERIQPTRRTATEMQNPNVQKVPDELSLNELYHIKRAAVALAAERTNYQLLIAWIGIFYFLGALTAAYIRTATATQNNQTAHTLAVVMLFSWLLFAVYISGHVGTFKSPFKVIIILEELSSELPNLFPSPSSNFVGRDEGTRFHDRYYSAAPRAGINSSWRPLKELRNVIYSDRSSATLFFIALLPVLFAWTAAFLLSYYTPLIGFGCRSGTWTMITVAWILSVGFDILMRLAVRFFVKSDAAWNALLWKIVITKDTLVTVGAIGMVAVAQIGFMNTCWCRASLVFKVDKNTACIDLGSVTEQQLKDNWYVWLIIPTLGLIAMLLDIFWAGYEGDNGRLLYQRTASERIADEKGLENASAILNSQRQRPPSSRVPTPGRSHTPSPTGRSSGPSTPYMGRGNGSSFDQVHFGDEERNGGGWQRPYHARNPSSSSSAALLSPPIRYG